MKTELSIILPVYNAEKTIDQCINSIVNQSYSDWELLIVDDGSTDSSPILINDWVKKDKRVSAFRQINKGVSAARNLGLREAKGRFIQFVDADDYIMSDCCEKMINGIGNADICACGINEIVDGNIIKSKKIKLEQSCENESAVSLAFLLYESDLLNSPFNKLFRSELIADVFPENMSMGEDLIFNLNYFRNCASVSIVSDCLYQYVRNESSSSKKFRKNMSNMQCRIYEDLYSFFDEMPVECRTTIDNKFFEHMVQLVFKRSILSKNTPRKERRFCIEEGLKMPLFQEVLKRYRPLSAKEMTWLFLLKTRLIYLALL